MSVRLSPQHGVNPSLLQCFFCMKDKGIALMGHIGAAKATALGMKPEGHDNPAPRQICFDKEPCDECAGYMEQGIILISVKDGEMGSDNPHRTNKWVVVKDDVVKRILMGEEQKSLLADILRKRVCFLEDAVWTMLGLPEGE
jgi:hypothetical protein